MGTKVFMSKTILSISIWVIILIGLSGVVPLVQTEFSQGDVCPKIIGIPACYVILACLLSIIIGHINMVKKAEYWYFIGVMIALFIASYGSIFNYLGKVACPKTSTGIPMCYLSYLIFFGLFVFKLLILKIEKANS